MMMRSLVFGGLACVCDRDQEVFAHMQATRDYHPNPDGRFELTGERQMLEMCFPDPAIYGDKVIKLFAPPWGGLERIRAGEYKIVWLHRPAKERWASFVRAHAKKPLELCFNRLAQEHRDERVQETFGILKQRRDVKLYEVDYEDVIREPLPFFRCLKRAGWPIDPAEAATIPNPEKKRF